MPSAQKQPELEPSQPFIKGWNEMAAKVVKKTPKEWPIERVKKELGDKWNSILPDSALTLIAQSKDPKKKIEDITKAFSEIEKAEDVWAHSVFDSLHAHENIAKLFVHRPNQFAEITKATYSWASQVFDDFDADENIAKLFAQHPNEFVEIAKATGERGEWRVGERVTGEQALYAFNALRNESMAKRFLDHCNGKMTFDVFILPILLSSDSGIAIELGRPLDDLHDNPPERMKYLNRLSTIQVFSLLLSDPEFFYTSSNHLMFDRLKKDLGKTSISDFFNKYELLGTEWQRNFIFRAINYDRFYAKINPMSKGADLAKPMFREADLKSAIDAMFSPLEAEKFDAKYFFLLANGLDRIKQIPALKGEIQERLSGRLKGLQRKKELNDDEKQIRSALEFLLSTMNKIDEKAFFDPSLYSTKGKLQVMQVFVKEDTKDYDWGATQNWFAKYAKPKKGEDGELIYETKTARITLFAGDDENQNQDFVKKQLEKNPNMIITFRGHGFNLEKNFPYDIFGNRKNHILFIPGSCGSAGDVPAYISANKDTDLRFFSNTSTGMGQVTNTIVDALINTRSGKEFKIILKENASRIKANGMGYASAETIKVWSPGEALLSYVYSH